MTVSYWVRYTLIYYNNNNNIYLLIFNVTNVTTLKPIAKSILNELR